MKQIIRNLKIMVETYVWGPISNKSTPVSKFYIIYMGMMLV